MPISQHGRKGRVHSSRGHVRVEQGPGWIRYGIAAVTIVLVIITVAVLITRFVIPLVKDDTFHSENRTWLEFEWTRMPVNQSAVDQLALRLKESDITRVYLEANAWRADGVLVEGDYAAEFASALRSASPDLKILLWLRMSGEEITQAERRQAVTDLAERAVRQWDFDGVQLNARAVYKGSDSYIQLIRDLRDAVGNDALLSVTVPPDRIPSDPDVPVGTTLDADLTWDMSYKQRIGLLQVDEMVIMAHASGLQDSGQYTIWVAYQLASYIDALAELDQQPEFIVAVPTYDQGPEHDPVIETMQASIEGVTLGLNRLGEAGDRIRGIGLYEYKTTDSLEWAMYHEYWLKDKTD